MQDNIKDIIRIREQTDYLGYEFLTWLFLLIDGEDKDAVLKKVTGDLIHKTDIIMTLGERLVTCLLSHKEQKTSVVTPILESSHEVFASIKNGHLIEALSIKLYLGEVQLSLVLHAQDFAFTQVKIKNNFEQESFAEQEENLNEADKVREEIFLRMKALEEVELIVDALFGHFCHERLQHSIYQERLSGMQRQVESRLDSYLQKRSVPKAAVNVSKPM